MADYKRRKKLIKPRLQLRLTAVFVGLSGLSLLLQYVLFQNRLHGAAIQLPNDGAVLLSMTNGLLAEVLLTSFLVFLPLTFLVGVMTTFRIAGPLYRFEVFLERLRRGERPEDFRLRKNDQLHEFADLLQAATAPMRTAEGQDEPDAAGSKDASADAA